MRSKAKTLSSIIRSAASKKTSNTSFPNPQLKTLEKPSKKSKAKKSPSVHYNALRSVGQQTLLQSSEDTDKNLLRTIGSILGGSNCEVSDSCESLDSEDTEDGKLVGNILDIPWPPSASQAHILLRRKEISRERKSKWIFKNNQTYRFQRLVSMCGQKLGAERTLEVFGKLGKETGPKEYGALVGLCVEKARTMQDEDVCLDYIHRAYELLRSMKEQGFKRVEIAYGQLLMYLIDMSMVEEFFFFCGVIKDEDRSTTSRLGYYEMLLWIKVDNNDKIQELCNSIAVDTDNGEGGSQVGESYILALCENDRKELLQLFEVVDITKVSSLDCVSCIFKFLGRLSLQSFAEKFILAFKTSEVEAENLSCFICDYAMSIPNFADGNVIPMIKNLHERLGMTPSSTLFEKLIAYCCVSLKVHAAISLLDQMCELGLTPSNGIIISILRAVEESCELELVYPIYSMISRHNLKADGETFRSLINLHAKIKDFEGAYNILTDLQKMDMKPTASMYNAILAGYFREKNAYGALMVINQMKKADVKPDSLTYSYLIGNAESEDDIAKHHEELKSSGIQATKHVYMSVINAYVKCGLIEKAKQVVFEKGIPVKHINDIKSALLSALASCGQMSDALKIYEEMKQDQCDVEPKAIISLIEYLQSEGELDRLLLLLAELKEPDYWFDACGRIISYCIRYKHLSSAIDLLKQLKDHEEMSTDAVLDQVFCQISESDQTTLDIGMDLLQAIKEELKLRPSRTSLDFLLSACVSAKDTIRAWFVWQEYQKAGLPMNVLTFLRMYQLLLASGESKAAKRMLKKIPKDDPHVRHIVKACQETFLKSGKGENQ